MRKLAWALVMAMALGVGAMAGAGLRAQTLPPDPIEGNPHAAVKMVMYEDLECPKCAAFHKALFDSIIPEYGARVEFIFRDFHISYHPWSYNAALIARYLDTKSPKLGMAWRSYCFTHQSEIYPGTLLDQAAAFCAPHGITRAELANAFAMPGLFAELQRDQQEAMRAHLTATPFILIDGTVLPDSATVADLVNALKAAIAAKH